ncbi:MAG TPA: hypothetical protein VF306_19000 [Pirellulales bacterium]
MTRILNENETERAGQMFGLTDILNAAVQIVAAKKQAFTAAQNELRAAEAGLQKAQEELAAFIKTRLGTAST